jgi:glutathione S-transferase
MHPLHLVIGNKAYSSWSQRPWILMTAVGIPFHETVIPLRQPDTPDRIRAFSPSGRVPVLVDGDQRIWETLAIVEYLAELFPEKRIWPEERAARAHARSIANEMHAGFANLRTACPTDYTRRFAPAPLAQEVQEEVRRIESIWSQTRRRFGALGHGPFLFGAFTAADAMFAPVVSRFHTYQVPLVPEAQVYADAVRAHPAWQKWIAGAAAETWVVTAFDRGLTVVEDLRAGR